MKNFTSTMFCMTIAALIFISTNLTGQIKSEKINLTSTNGPEPTMSTSWATMKIAPKLDGSNVVKWSYIDVKDVEMFTVQMSKNNQVYTDVKSIEPIKKSTHIITNYEVLLDEFKGKQAFIRIQALLTDGTVTNSIVRKAYFFGHDNQEVETWPNPVGFELNVANIDPSAQQIIIYNTSGYREMTQSIRNISETTLYLPKLRPGYYHLMVLDSAGEVVQKRMILKQ